MNVTRSLGMWFDNDVNFLLNSRLLDSFGARGRMSSCASGRIDRDPKFSNGLMISALGKTRRLWSLYSNGEETILVSRGRFAYVLRLSTGFLGLTVYSRGPDARTELMRLMERYGRYRLQNEDEDGVWADFSYAGPHGPVRITEFLCCPLWADIRKNYPVAVRSRLDGIMKLDDPWKRGSLIIWHGAPGVGKTYAIRSLLMAWKRDFNFLVVTDPENFTKTPSYYYQVASESGGRRKRRVVEPDMMPSKGKATRSDGRKKRCIFIMEDCADLILQESRAAHFDKVGKLLNATDGLFGQGREDIFLLTFNEDVDRIDPAFLRPGRCIADVEFTPFPEDEAAEWLLEQRVLSVGRDGPMTLAEMYAATLKQGAGTPSEPAKLVGFARK